MIELKNVTKRYGNICAVDDITFTIGKGEIVGFLGQNGAGKSTTMNMITGYISRSSGTITVDGMDILEHPSKVKALIGYLPEQPPLYMDMTVTEYLTFVCELKKVNAKDLNGQIKSAIKTTQLDEVKHRIIGNLSKGFKQRVGLAQTLCGYPKVIILDEPTVGLDPKQIVEIRETIKRLGQKHTVILSSHILHDVAEVCQRIIIINNGKIIADDDISHLTKGASDKEVLLRIKGSKDTVLNTLGALKGCTVKYEHNYDADINEYIVTGTHKDELSGPIMQALYKNKLPLLLYKPASTSLEDTFLRLTQQVKEA